MLLEVKNLCFSYAKPTSKASDRLLYNNFNLTVNSDERLGIIAPSGFGKTTLCKLIAGYERPLSGEVLLDGIPLENYKGYCPIQMIWQHPELAVNPKLKMKEILSEAGKIPKEMLSALGIQESWMTRYPIELSGGELQRFCIARALAPDTKFLIADEISTMLDLVTQSQLWHFLISEVSKRNIGLITVSHSEALLDQIATKKLNLFSKAN